MQTDTDTISKHLKNSKANFQDVSSPSQPGVYAFFLAEDAKIGALSHHHDHFLYIGQSANLAEREHFDSRKTGFSTLRRSIGAVLKEQLQLIAIPRAPGKSDSNFRCYRFMPDGEERLSGWMIGQLLYSSYASDEFEILEGKLIDRFEPLFNLKGWPNQQRNKIKALRKKCADEARLNS